MMIHAFLACSKRKISYSYPVATILFATIVHPLFKIAQLAVQPYSRRSKSTSDILILDYLVFSINLCLLSNLWLTLKIYLAKKERIKISNFLPKLATKSRFLQGYHYPRKRHLSVQKNWKFKIRFKKQKAFSWKFSRYFYKIHVYTSKKINKIIIIESILWN